jgi:hypothetical protein
MTAGDNEGYIWRWDDIVLEVNRTDMPFEMVYRDQRLV